MKSCLTPSPATPSDVRTPEPHASRRPHRQVRFDAQVRGRVTLHHNNYTRQEFDATWYTPKERQKMRQNLERTVQLIEQGKIPIQRGLESRAATRTSKVPFYHLCMQSRFLSKAAVLNEQSVQQNADVCFPSAIARSYRKYTLPCQIRALLLAWSDHHIQLQQKRQELHLFRRQQKSSQERLRYLQDVVDSCIDILDITGLDTDSHHNIDTARDSSRNALADASSLFGGDMAATDGTNSISDICRHPLPVSLPIKSTVLYQYLHMSAAKSAVSNDDVVSFTSLSSAPTKSRKSTTTSTATTATATATKNRGKDGTTGHASSKSQFCFADVLSPMKKRSTRSSFGKLLRGKDRSVAAAVSDISN